MDSKAFDALLECIAEGDLDTCEQVPAGDEDGFLVNPLGGPAVDMSGPAGYVLNFVFSHIYHYRAESLSSCAFEMKDTTGSVLPLCSMRWPAQNDNFGRFVQYSRRVPTIEDSSNTLIQGVSGYREGRARSMIDEHGGC